MEDKGYSGWVIIELFGRQMLAGMASEEIIAGTTFLRLDVPTVDGILGFTKYYGGAAIYALTPTTEEMARAAVKRLQPRPVDPWIFNFREIPAHTSEDEGGEDERTQADVPGS